MTLNAIFFAIKTVFIIGINKWQLQYNSCYRINNKQQTER